MSLSTWHAPARGWSLVLRAAVLAIALSGLVFACSLGDVDFTNKACPCGTGYVCDSSRNVCVTAEQLLSDAAVRDAGCKGDSCPCTVDAECTDSARSRCGPNKVCVECVASNDTCPAGSYCNATNQCTLGCKQESDCQISPASPHCETVTHQCVTCRTGAGGDCPGGQVCSPSGACTQTCGTGNPCATGECCGGFCIDTSTDPLNCGGCGVKCSTTNGTPKCQAKACTWACANGFAHCAPANENTGCETNIRSDGKHCGSCTTDCATTVKNAGGVTCNAGACGYGTCNLNFGDCDGDPKNGCDCACGAAKGDRCCPGNFPCNFTGGHCTGSGNCQ